MAHGALIVHTSDFIDDASRTNFMNFDNPGTLIAPNEYMEDGITIRETSGPVGASASFMNGSFNYYFPHINYPNQFGYTILTMADNSKFGAIGMDISTGYGLGQEIAWAVLNQGVAIAQGVLTGTYLGFEGIDFDEIWLKGPAANTEPGAPHANLYGAYSNLIALDNIEVRKSGHPGTNVPEPGTLALMGIAGLAIAYRRRVGAVRKYIS